MCQPLIKPTTLEWLEGQVKLLECWIEDLAAQPSADMTLVECVENHKKWLLAELAIIKAPERYRLSNFARNVVYPLIEQESGMAAKA